MTILAKGGSLTVDTSIVGTLVPVTGLGFSPTVVVCWWSGTSVATDGGGRADVIRGLGVTAGPTARLVTSSVNDDGRAGSSGAHLIRTDAVIATLNTALALDTRWDTHSFDADGFTLEVDDASAGSIRVHYLALGGDSLTAVKTGFFAEPGAIGAQSVLGVGFEPDALLLLPSREVTDPPGSIGDSFQALGLVARQGAAISQALILAANDFINPSQAVRYARTGDCVGLVNGAATVLDGRASCTAMLADGFQLTWAKRAGTRRIGYVAIQGGSWAVGDLVTATDLVAFAETGLGFTPKAVIFASHGAAQSAVDTLQDGDSWIVGAAAGAADQRVMATTELDAQATTRCGRWAEHDAVYASFATEATLDDLMAVTALDADGFTVQMSDASASPKYVAYLAAGDPAVVGGGGGARHETVGRGIARGVGRGLR